MVGLAEKRGLCLPIVPDVSNFSTDKDLCRRIRKIPGAPIMQVARGKYVIERLPNAPTT